MTAEKASSCIFSSCFLKSCFETGGARCNMKPTVGLLDVIVGGLAALKKTALPSEGAEHYDVTGSPLLSSDGQLMRI